MKRAGQEQSLPGDLCVVRASNSIAARRVDSNGFDFQFGHIGIGNIFVIRSHPSSAPATSVQCKAVLLAAVPV